MFALLRQFQDLASAQTTALYNYDPSNQEDYAKVKHVLACSTECSLTVWAKLIDKGQLFF
jgi:hypothetical protein